MDLSPSDPDYLPNQISKFDAKLQIIARDVRQLYCDIALSYPARFLAPCYRPSTAIILDELDTLVLLLEEQVAKLNNRVTKILTNSPPSPPHF